MKKLLSTFLIVAMVLCFMPTMAFAAVSGITIDTNYDVTIAGVEASKSASITVGSASAEYTTEAGKLKASDKTKAKSVWDAVAAHATKTTPASPVTTIANGAYGEATKGKLTVYLPAGTSYVIGSDQYTLTEHATITFASNLNITKRSLNDNNFTSYLVKAINATTAKIAITVTFQSSGGGGSVTPPTTDDPKRFKKLKKVLLDTGKGMRELEVVQVKFFKNLVILKFRGCDKIEDVMGFKGRELYVTRENAAGVPGGCGQPGGGRVLYRGSDRYESFFGGWIVSGNSG